MMRAEPWTLAKLLVAMEHPELSEKELAIKLGNWEDVSAGVARIGLHAYHENMGSPMVQALLPEICRVYLGRKDRLVVACPLCGTYF